MVKTCAWGRCKSDSRYPERLAGGVEFVPFCKPRRNLERCLRWIKACGRPPHKLNVEKVDNNRHLFVCTKHFIDGWPSERHPDPIPACPDEEPSQPLLQPAPRERAAAEPVEEPRLTAAGVPGTLETPVLDCAVKLERFDDFMAEMPPEAEVEMPPEVKVEMAPEAEVEMPLAIKLERPDTPTDLYEGGANQAMEQDPFQMDGGAATSSGQTLRMLALTLENRNLREELEKTRAEMDRLRNDLTTQVQKNQVLQKQVGDANQARLNSDCLQASMLHFHNLMNDNFKQYTGVDYHEFLKIYMSWCQDAASKK